MGSDALATPKDVSRAILGSTCEGPGAHFVIIWKHFFILGPNREKTEASLEFPSGFEHFGNSKDVTGAILGSIWEGPGAQFGAILQHF